MVIMVKEEYSKRYREIHRKELAKKQREYIKKHPVNWHEHYQKYRDSYVRRAMKKHNKVKKEIFDLLGNKCTNPCNINHGDFIQDIRCLQIDHVHGGGSKEIKRMKSPFKYYEFILQKIKIGSNDYQLLCANCNQIKRKINKENRTIKG